MKLAWRPLLKKSASSLARSMDPGACSGATSTLTAAGQDPLKSEAHRLEWWFVEQIVACYSEQDLLVVAERLPRIVE